MFDRLIYKATPGLLAGLIYILPRLRLSVPGLVCVPAFVNALTYGVT